MTDEDRDLLLKLADRIDRLLAETAAIKEALDVLKSHIKDVRGTQ